MKLRLLNAAEVRALLPMSRYIELMRDAVRLVAQHRALQPIRTVLRPPHGKGHLSFMPGYIAEPGWLGIKVVSVFPGNFGTERGSHQGLVLLFEPGYGEQARAHARSVPLVRPIERIIVWGRDAAKAKEFCDWAAAETGVQAEAVPSARAAIHDADVICSTTAAADPVIEGTWLHAGQHLNVVGSSIPSTAEVDIETVTRSRYFVDFKDSALELAGEFRRAWDAGAVGEDHILGSIGDVLVGNIVGRTGNEDITLFKSLGMVCEDLISADFVLREGERLDVGTVVEW